MHGAILGIAVAYTLLCKLNYGHHNHAQFSSISSKQNTFQLQNLTWVMRTIWLFLWYQNLQMFEKSWKKIRVCIFKCITSITELFPLSIQFNLSLKWSFWASSIAQELLRSLQHQFHEVAKVADSKIPSYCIKI